MPDVAPPSFKRPIEKLSDEAIQELLGKLRRKEGGWLAWGRACKSLHDSQCKPLDIFEETGFEQVQQLQVMVGSQVFDSLVKGGASETAIAHYRERGSDVLYQLRELDQTGRIKAAEFALEHGLDMDEARLLAKDSKEFSWIKPQPEGFSPEPGDAVAFFCWKRARQRAELAERSLLIAQGLKFAQSNGAREKLQALLTDFTVVPEKKAPRLPFYRLEQEDELPRTVPVAGSLPLTAAALEQLPQATESGAFRLVRSEQPCTWLSLPGWQVVLWAKRPAAILCSSQDLPDAPEGNAEEVAAVVDLGTTDWSADHFHLIETDGQLAFRWTAQAPEEPLLGRLVLLLKPKRVFDENVLQEPWQMV